MNRNEASGAGGAADGGPPVTIEFDNRVEPEDIVTHATLPHSMQAVRGSVRFHFGRLDTPERGFGYFFDGRGYQPVDELALIRKMKGPGAWAIVGGRGWRGREQPSDRTNPLNICEIEHHAVSFVPLDPSTGEKGERVYVLLEDLYRIQWRRVDHWVATMSQQEFEAAEGSMY